MPIRRQVFASPTSEIPSSAASFTHGLPDKVASGQIINLFAVDGWIETPVKVFQRFQAAEISGLGAAFHQPLLAHVDFVLVDQFQELGVAKPVGDGFLQYVQGLHQAGKSELFQRGLQGAHIRDLG